jgi:predicted methyltransferase
VTLSPEQGVFVRVIFLTDYRGKLTQERFFVRGEEADLFDGDALAIVEAGFAEAVVIKEQDNAITEPQKGSAKRRGGNDRAGGRKR